MRPRQVESVPEEVTPMSASEIRLLADIHHPPEMPMFIRHQRLVAQILSPGRGCHDGADSAPNLLTTRRLPPSPTVRRQLLQVLDHPQHRWIIRRHGEVIAALHQKFWRIVAPRKHVRSHVWVGKHHAQDVA